MDRVGFEIIKCDKRFPQLSVEALKIYSQEGVICRLTPTHSSPNTALGVTQKRNGQKLSLHKLWADITRTENIA